MENKEDGKNKKLKKKHLHINGRDVIIN